MKKVTFENHQRLEDVPLQKKPSPSKNNLGATRCPLMNAPSSHQPYDYVKIDRTDQSLAERGLTVAPQDQSFRDCPGAGFEDCRQSACKGQHVDFQVVPSVA